MYHVSAKGVDERMINVHYYHYCYYYDIKLHTGICPGDVSCIQCITKQTKHYN